MFEVQSGSSDVDVFDKDVGVIDEHGVHEVVLWLGET